MKYIIIVFFLCNTFYASSQFYIEDKEMLLSNYDCLWVSSKDSTIKELKEITCKGLLKISDPYLFYPERFEVSESYQLIDQSLTRMSDSVYSFNLELVFIKEDPFSDIVFYLCGYALAGSDSICSISFEDVELNGININNFSGKIIIQTQNNSIPYIRMPKLKALTNPILADEVIFQAILWQDTDLIFEVFDITGRIRQLLRINGKNNGESKITLSFDELSSGVYNILMHTNHGTAIERILLIK
jgi:hypothetical protein